MKHSATNNIPEEHKELADQIDKVHTLSVLAESEAGAILTKALLTDVANNLDKLIYSYKDATHAELIAYCASLASPLGIYRALTQAKGSKEELLEILQEALQN